MKKMYYLPAFILIFVFSCSKTVETESNKWESSKTRIHELSAVYPSMKAVLQEKLANAEVAMKAAQSISDEKQKIEAMSKANVIATAQFITDLEAMDAKIKEVKSLGTKAIQEAFDENDKLAAKKASGDADMLISEAKLIINNATITTESDAAAIVSKAINSISSAKDNLNAVLKTITDKKTADKTKKDNEKAEQEKKEKEQKDAVADIKCEFCGNSNKYDAGKCVSCGATVEKK